MLKDVMISHTLVYHKMCTTTKDTELLKGMENCNTAKTISETKGAFKFNKLLD